MIHMWGPFSGWWFEECAGCFRVNVSLPPPHLPHKCPCGNRLGVATSRHWTAAVSLVASLWKEATHIDTVVSQLFNDRTGITRHPTSKNMGSMAKQTQHRENQHSLVHCQFIKEEGFQQRDMRGHYGYTEMSKSYALRYTCKNHNFE